MERLLLAVAIVAIAAIVAAVLRRRRAADPPTQAGYVLPTQLDRADFPHPEVPWLVAVFSSSTCSTCADVISKAQVLASDDVAVVSLPYQEHADLHARYGIEAVPGTVVAGPDGAVSAAFLGPVTATDLWAAVADSREPGAVDRSGGCDRHD